MGGILLLTILGGGIVLIVGGMILVRLRGPEKTNQDSAVLRFTGIGAIAYGVLVAVSTLWTAVMTLTATHVPVALPVRTFWPDPARGVSDLQGPTADVVSGGFVVAQVDVAGLDLPARSFLAGGSLVQGSVYVLIAVVVAMLCRQLLREAPFAGAVTTSLTAAGVTLGIGGIIWQVLYGIGGVLASHQVLKIDGWAYDGEGSPNDSVAHGLPEPSYAGTIEFWPIFIALALLAVAAAFRIGERMQRETAGLV